MSGRILIVTQYFWPESFRINDLAVGLKERGFEVTVLTGTPNYPGGKAFPGYNALTTRTETYEGIKVVRSPLITRGRAQGLRLLLNYLSFAVSAGVVGLLRLRGPFDIVFVFEPSPITVCLPAIALRRRFGGIPLVLWVQDLWPESVAAVLPTPPRGVSALLDAMVRYIYSRCDLILVQSRQFIESVRTRAPGNALIRYFPNTAEKIYCPVSVTPGEARAADLPEGFRVMFAGNIGSAQDFPTILAAAELLKDRSDIQWLILGDGRLRKWVESEVERRGLSSTFHLLGSHSMDRMPFYFSFADALLTTLKRDPILARTIPSKVQSYMACEKPVIAALDGEGSRLIMEARAGVTCEAESPRQLADAVLSMAAMSPAQRAALGANGLAYFREQFARDLLLDRLAVWLRDLVAGRITCER